jgi:beta-galactosidase
MSEAKAAGFTYGAVYYRKTNPPEADWERDYAVAKEDGFTTFRHWFMWTGIEPTPGGFEWEDYDRQLDLAAENGMKTVIAEHIEIAPEWAFARFPHARYERADGSRIDSSMQVSSSIGGAPGLCLDNDDVLERAENFLRELVTRYHDHPGLGGYDVWNECNVDPNTCFCDGTADKFRGWLRRRYGDDVRALRVPWGRFYSSWDEVRPPRELGMYGQSLDWLEFRRDRGHELMRWRIELIRSIDSRNTITAHGVAGSLGYGIARGIDDWASAAEVESYGFTFVASRRGDEAWKQPLAVEVVRSASRGKPFWHAEMQAGPLWWQPQVNGRPLDDGRVSTPDDIRYWHLASMAGGVTGIFNLRWRPLLDGPLFQAFGGYAMDGSRTERSEQASAMAKWAAAPEQADLWNARPVPSGMTMLFVPESQAFAYITQHDTKNYEHAITGAWRAFFDAGVTADFKQLAQLDEAEVAYLPYPQLLPRKWADALKEWVRNGGTLISEGAPAWFTDHAHANTSQPGSGLDELFGAVEAGVEFAPDILDQTTFDGDGYSAYGGEVRQWFTPTTGSAVANYADGSIAVVDNEFGKGRTRLIGTNAGRGYFTHEDKGTAEFYRQTLDWAGIAPLVQSSDPRAIIRLHRGEVNDFLWVLNPTRTPIEPTVRLAAESGFDAAYEVLWGDAAAVSSTDARTATIGVPARDAIIIRLGRSAR